MKKVLLKVCTNTCDTPCLFIDLFLFKIVHRDGMYNLPIKNIQMLLLSSPNKPLDLIWIFGYSQCWL